MEDARAEERVEQEAEPEAVAENRDFAKDQAQPGDVEVQPEQATVEMAEAVNPEAEPPCDEAESAPIDETVSASVEADPDAAESELDPKAVVEALLFSAHSPVKASRLAAAADMDTKEVDAWIRTLNEEYDREKRAFHIIPVAKGYQMMSKTVFFPHIQKLTKARTRDKLTGAALETLAIIAYKQPIIRAEVEAIRGVQSGQIIRNLLETRLIRVTGRDKRLGHPLLYGTTPRFLEVFGLKSLKDLPSLDELKAF